MKTKVKKPAVKKADQKTTSAPIKAVEQHKENAPTASMYHSGATSETHSTLLPPGQ